MAKRRVKSVGRTETLADRLARLTFLCSEIQHAAKGQRVPTDRLHATLSEAQELCDALRQEIERRAAEDAE